MKVAPIMSVRTENSARGGEVGAFGGVTTYVLCLGCPLVCGIRTPDVVVS